MAQYCRLLPMQSRGQDNPYQQNTQLDFMLNVPSDKEILYNSFQLGFTLLVNGVALDPTSRIYLNQYSGYHSLIDSIQTLVDDVSVETIQTYPRFVACQNFLNNSDVNMQFELSKNSAGLCANNILSQRQLLGINYPPSVAPLGYTKGDVPCDLKLNFCLNKSYNGQMQPANISGGKKIHIIVRLNSAVRALWGDDVNSTTSYTLNNVVLQWVQEPKTQSAEVVLQTVNMVKNPIPSGSVNISVNTPSLTNKWMMSFSANLDEITPTMDYYRLSTLPSLSRVDLLVNDMYSNNKYPLTLGYQAASEVVETSMMALSANPENASSWFKYFNDRSGSLVSQGRGLILGSVFPAFAPPNTRVSANLICSFDSTVSTWFAYTYLFCLQKL